MLRTAGVVALLIGTGCGSSAKSTPANYRPAQSKTSLASSGWTVANERGMQPLAGGSQLAYFVIRSPDGVRVTTQFLDSSKRADNELKLALRTLKSFHGAVARNVLIFASPNGTAKLPDKALNALRLLLR